MSDDAVVTPRKLLRVVVADDDAFTASLVAGGLRSHGFSVSTATTTAEAWQLIADEDPHALVSDLNFGPGESGAALLRRVHHEFPWVGLVVLTSHLSPELAVEDSTELPPGLVYLVKSQLREVEELATAVSQAIAGSALDARPTKATRNDTKPGTIVLTTAQAEALRMLAAGASTKVISPVGDST